MGGKGAVADASELYFISHRGLAMDDFRHFESDRSIYQCSLMCECRWGKRFFEGIQDFYCYLIAHMTTVH